MRRPSSRRPQIDGTRHYRRNAARVVRGLLAPLDPDRRGPHPADRRSRAIDAAADIIRHAPEQELDIDSLADGAHLSRSHFSALFRRQIGMSALQFQMQLRMSRAKKLLDTTDLPIGRISWRVGYDDAYYFRASSGRSRA